jgi:hypothetical protein
MKQEHTRRKSITAGVVAVAAFAIVGPSASAQDSTTTSTTSSLSAGNLTTASGKVTSATEQMIQEACQRQKARTEKFQKFGIPERFGSEEPFTFDPKVKC